MTVIIFPNWALDQGLTYYQETLERGVRSPYSSLDSRTYFLSSLASLQPELHCPYVQLPQTAQYDSPQPSKHLKCS